MNCLLWFLRYSTHRPKKSWIQPINQNGYLFLSSIFLKRSYKRVTIIRQNIQSVNLTESSRRILIHLHSLLCITPCSSILSLLDHALEGDMCWFIQLRSLEIWHDRDLAALDFHSVIDHQAPNFHRLQPFDLAVALTADSEIYDVSEFDDTYHFQFAPAQDHVVFWPSALRFSN